MPHCEHTTIILIIYCSPRQFYPSGCQLFLSHVKRLLMANLKQIPQKEHFKRYENCSIFIQNLRIICTVVQSFICRLPQIEHKKVYMLTSYDREKNQIHTLQKQQIFVSIHTRFKIRLENFILFVLRHTF
ncbi:hypothetical protein LXL04_022844 [Taraxacum kok-saghyz]